jgi:hypothetical protein
MSLENSLIIGMSKKMPGLPEESEFRRDWIWNLDENTQD